MSPDGQLDWPHTPDIAARTDAHGQHLWDMLTWSPFGTSLGAVELGHMEGLFLVFWGTPILTSTLAASVCILQPCMLLYDTSIHFLFVLSPCSQNSCTFPDFFLVSCHIGRLPPVPAHSNRKSKSCCQRKHVIFIFPNSTSFAYRDGLHFHMLLTKHFFFSLYDWDISLSMRGI